MEFSLGFYLSRMLVEFSLTCIFQHVWEKCFNLWCSHSQKIIESMLFYSCPSSPLMCGKKFTIYSVHIPRKSLNLYFFTHTSVPHSKLVVEFFENLFPKDRRGGRSYDLLYQNSIRKYKDDLEHQFISIWYDCNFSKCDGFTIL